MIVLLAFIALQLLSGNLLKINHFPVCTCISYKCFHKLWTRDFSIKLFLYESEPDKQSKWLKKNKKKIQT